jgi:membrane protein insertase Oxa1/YidC/SpoIIIJ
MGMGLIILFLVLFAPLLFGIIFLLARLSSRFGYSLITLRAPMIAIIISVIYTVFIFFVSSLFERDVLYWICGVLFLSVIVLWVIDSRYLHKLAKQRKIIVKKLNTNRHVVKIIARVILVVLYLNQAKSRELCNLPLIGVNVVE